MDVMLPTYAEALADVMARVAKSRSSFAAGMAILPRARREAMYGLYAFCREVDDIADDSPTPEKAAAGLTNWRQRISELFRGKPSDTITIVLQRAIAAYGLVEEDFQAIIDGMVMDVAVIRAPSEDMFDLYCDRVASAVGRVSVRIFGDSSPQAMQVSHHLGRALQTTNILRDLKEDASRGRLYLPVELLSQNGIISRQPEEVLRDPRVRQACRDLSRRADEHFRAADKAMASCKRWAMRPARIMRGYYAAILEQLKAGEWRDLSQRGSLPKWQKLLIVLRYGIV
jgi:phytoene synthase